MKLLEVKNIRKSYQNFLALDDLSFLMEEKEIIGLLGLNGAGKSTAIEIIATLQPADGGAIYYKGKNILQDPQAIRSEMGYVPQDISLFEDLSGWQNLEFWGRAYGLKGKQLRQALDRTIAICNLQEKIKAPVKSYSGGMKRRLNIGVAIMHMPKILVLDEATVGVDILSANKILTLIRDLNQNYGTSILFTSHNMTEIEGICDRFILLDRGKKISDIRKCDILKKYSSLETYFLSQISEK